MSPPPPPPAWLLGRVRRHYGSKKAARRIPVMSRVSSGVPLTLHSTGAAFFPPLIVGFALLFRYFFSVPVVIFHVPSLFTLRSL